MSAIAIANMEQVTDVLNALKTSCVIEEKTPSSIIASNPTVLSEIYQKNINMAIWKRTHSNELASAVTCFIAENSVKPTRLTVSAGDAYDELCKAFGDSHAATIVSKDIALLVDMFCCLFDLKNIGLRLAILNAAMCPRFHVDRIPCRLITTYQGLGTQWLAHDVVDRTKLGAGNQGKADEESGLFYGLDKMNSLNEGDVALLKGENWDDTTGFGLVHRSPSVPKGEKRLVLTLDFID